MSLTDEEAKSILQRYEEDTEYALGAIVVIEDGVIIRRYID